MSDTPTNPVFLAFPGGCLRPPLETDEELMQSWCGINHPENRIYLSRRYPQTLTAQRDWFTKPSTERNIVWIVENEGEAVGTMGVHGIDYINGHATTGALFWDQRHWNRGIGYKAKMVVLDHCFNMLNLRIVYSHVIDFNRRSTRYSHKCGYKEAARLKDHFRFGHTLVDEVTLAVTREEWEPLWETFRREHGIETLAETLERHKGINRSQQ